MYSVGSVSDYWIPRIQSPTYQDSHENWEFDLYSDLRRPQQLGVDVFRGPPSALPRWATVRQGGLGRGRREAEERWEESFYTPTYLPKMDGPLLLPYFALGVTVACDHNPAYYIPSLSSHWQYCVCIVVFSYPYIHIFIPPYTCLSFFSSHLIHCSYIIE